MAIRIAVASWWPYRECLRAASWRRSTSFGVRYSRSRRSAFGGRRGVTVRFTMVEGSRRVLGFFTGNPPLWKSDFPYNGLFAESCQFSPWAITTKFRGYPQCASVWLDVGSPDYLRPFVGFFGEELAVLGRRERERGVAEVGNPRPDPGIGEASVDLPVELIDNSGGCVPGCAEADPAASLIPRQEFGDGGDVRQRLHARRIPHA